MAVAMLVTRRPCFYKSQVEISGEISQVGWVESCRLGYKTQQQRM